MSGPTDLLLFAHLLRRSDHELDLESTALLLCEPEYPGLDIPGFLAKLEVMGELARIRLEASRRCGTSAADRVLPILRLLYSELSFRGNVTDYYDPKNSFLNEVIDRRTGNPISLAIVLMAVCRRAGVAAEGVAIRVPFRKSDDPDAEDAADDGQDDERNPTFHDKGVSGLTNRP